MNRTSRPPFGTLLFFTIAFALSLYFTFAAVQGDFGLFRRTEIMAESQDLRIQLATVRADVERMENLTACRTTTSISICWTNAPGPFWA